MLKFGKFKAAAAAVWVVENNNTNLSDGLSVNF